MGTPGLFHFVSFARPSWSRYVLRGDCRGWNKKGVRFVELSEPLFYVLLCPQPYLQIGRSIL